MILYQKKKRKWLDYYLNITKKDDKIEMNSCKPTPNKSTFI